MLMIGIGIVLIRFISILIISMVREPFLNTLKIFELIYGRDSFFNTFKCMKNTDTFFNAIREGNLDDVSKMLVANPDLVKAKDQRGSTPLILATYYNHCNMTNLLLDQGATIDRKDSSGNTALMGVCFKGFGAIAKKLIEQGANVNERNSMGSTCLIYAVTFKHIDIAKLLLANGADTSVKDGRGNSALDHAKLQGIPDLIDLLERPA